MRYSPVLIAAGTLALVACQQPEDDKAKGEDLPHPDINTTQSGGEVGSAQTQSNRPPGGEADAKEGVQSAQDEQASLSEDEAATFESEEYGVRITYPKRSVTCWGSRYREISHRKIHFKELVDAST